VAAYVLVYSITESSSFHWCVKQVLHIRHEDGNTRAAVILVGNKSDLVRSRQVAEDGEYWPTSLLAIT
jgi:GTPase SAR1 family protein